MSFIAQIFKCCDLPDATTKIQKSQTPPCLQNLPPTIFFEIKTPSNQSLPPWGRFFGVKQEKKTTLPAFFYFFSKPNNAHRTTRSPGVTWRVREPVRPAGLGVGIAFARAVEIAGTASQARLFEGKREMF